MHVIFLDVDGVLNGHDQDPDSRCNGICRSAITHLNRIIEATDARLVISSAWRYMMLGGAMSVRGFEYLLRTHGILYRGDELVVGHTVADEQIPRRPDQIRHWLAYSGVQVERFVVLDDLDDDWGYLPLVRTNGMIGLTAADADRAIEILRDRHFRLEALVSRRPDISTNSY